MRWKGRSAKPKKSKTLELRKKGCVRENKNTYFLTHMFESMKINTI